MDDPATPLPAPRTSKLAAASMFCFIFAIPCGAIAFGGRGADVEWIWPVGSIAALVLAGASVLMAIAAIVDIATHRDRVKGIGFAILALLLNAGVFAFLLLQILSAVGGRR